MLEAPVIDGTKDTSAEILNAQFVLTNPQYNLIASKERAFNYRYMVAEMLWNAQPMADLKPLSDVFPGVRRFVEDQDEWNREKVSWAYGFSVWPGLLYCYDELIDDPGSRRAVIRVGVNHRSSQLLSRITKKGTPPCLVSQQFLIRGGSLHSIVQMRSNDVWRGFPLDVYQFTMWQLILAAKLEIPVGDYYHNASSFHLYERDRKAAQAMVEGECAGITSSKPSSYFFDDLMKCKPMGVLSAAAQYARDKTGSGPWLGVYSGEHTELLTEFGYLKLSGYGSGWSN